MNHPHKPVDAYVLQRVYAAIAPTAAAIVNAQIPPMPQILLFRDTGNEPRFLRGITAEVVLTLHSQHGKHALPKFVALQFAKLSERVDVVAHVTEAVNAPTTAETADLLRSGVRLHELPGAHDVLMITLYTRDGEVGSIMPIEIRDGKRHVELAPLDLDSEWLGPTNANGLEAARKMTAGVKQ